MARTFRTRPLAWSDWPRRELDLGCRAACCSQKARRRLAKLGSRMKVSDRRRAAQ